MGSVVSLTTLLLTSACHYSKNAAMDSMSTNGQTTNSTKALFIKAGIQPTGHRLPTSVPEEIILLATTLHVAFAFEEKRK